jgi:hypothetical protein
MFCKKYMRIQGREISYQTKKPCGVFSLNHRRIREGVYSEADAQLFHQTDDWFKEALPQPPFYDEGNPQRAITWFKTEAFSVFAEKTETMLGLLDKYGVVYDILYTDHPGRIIYEDDFQVATAEDEA